MKNNSDSDPLGIYLKEVRKINLLTREEEVKLAKENYILTDKEKKKLNKIIEEESNLPAEIEKLTDAQKALVSANLRLVISIASEYKQYLYGSSLSFSDLILEGNSGLVRAAQKFEYLKGVKFATYAACWIRGKIEKTIHYKSGIIHIPPKRLQKLYRGRTFAKRQKNELDDSPRSEEIIAELDSTVKKMEGELPLRVLSFQHPVGDNGDSLLGEFIKDSNTIPAEEQIGKDELAEKIRRALVELKPREEKILRLLYSIGENSEPNRREIGDRFGITRERVWQIEAKAFGKLRNNPKIKALQH